MRVKKIFIKNFLAIGAAEIGLSERGLFLVQGENKSDSSASSNGAGKSTIADALEWCLYGETARGQSGDDVVNNVVRKDCCVQVVLIDDVVEYAITRYRKDSSFKNSLIVTQITPSSTTKDLTLGTTAETQELIEKILGMSREIFDASIYIGQERMPDLPAMTDKQLKLIIEEAAGVTQLQNAFLVAKSMFDDTRAACGINDTKLTNAENAIIYLENDKKSFTSNAADWDENRRDRLINKIAECKKVMNVLAGVKEEIATYDLGKIHAKISEIDKLIASTDDERAAIAEANKALSSANAIYAREKTNAENAIAKLKKAREKFAGVSEMIGKPCESCGRPHDESTLGELRSNAESDALECTETVTAYRERLDSARKALTDAQDTLSKLESCQTDIKEQTALKSDQEKILRRVTLLGSQISSYTDSVKSLKEAAAAIKDEINPYHARLEDIDRRMNAAVIDLENLSKENEILKRELKLCAKAVEIFGVAGVRAHILDTATPFLNDRTSHYLGHLSDGNISAQWSTLSTTKKGEIREKFKIEVQKNVGSASFSGLSGGEKRKARLACAMALQDLVSSRAVKPFHLFIADEIDDAVDEAGLERLMTILEEKARERETVMVISHNSLNSWIRNTLTVVNNGGIAHIE